MSFGEHSSERHGKWFGLFAAAFVLFTIIIMMLSQVGLPDSAAAILFALVALATFITIGFIARTMRLSDFQVAARSVPPVLNGMATASAFLASAGFLGLAGAFFGGRDTALAVVAGWTMGFLILSALIAPYFRRTAAVSVADFLAIRFASRAVRLAAVIITLASSFALLIAEISAVSLVAANLLDITANTGIAIALVLIVGGTLLGGMRAVTMTAIAQYIVLAVAFLAPVTVLSIQSFGLPLPQLTYGYAIDAVAELGGAASITTTSQFFELAPLDGFNMAVLAFCLAAGVASMPSILVRSATASGAATARLSAGWGLLFVLIVVTAAPAYAAFAELALTVSPLSDPINIDTIVLALPGLTGLSSPMTALVATGAIAAILATATALLFAIANTIGHDFYAGLIDRHGPPGRQLIVTRLVLIAVACLAGWYAANPIDDIFSLAATSFSLAASGLFPALFLGIWWKRATPAAALFGMVFGFAVAAAYVLMVLYGEILPWQPLGNTGTGMPPMAAAFFGVPVGLLVIILVSYITPRPTPERIEMVQALRRPIASRLFNV